MSVKVSQSIFLCVFNPSLSVHLPVSAPVSFRPSPSACPIGVKRCLSPVGSKSTHSSTRPSLSGGAARLPPRPLCSQPPSLASGPSARHSPPAGVTVRLRAARGCRRRRPRRRRARSIPEASRRLGGGGGRPGDPTRPGHGQGRRVTAPPPPPPLGTGQSRQPGVRPRPARRAADARGCSAISGFRERERASGRRLLERLGQYGSESRRRRRRRRRWWRRAARRRHRRNARRERRAAVGINNVTNTRGVNARSGEIWQWGAVG